MIERSAPGKLILLGEHAAVYGYPVLGIPLSSVRATAVVADAPFGSGLELYSLGLGVSFHYDHTLCAQSHPLLDAVSFVLHALGVTAVPDVSIELRSSIPISAGLGSGAATAAAVVKALFAWFDVSPTLSLVNQIVYSVERLYHGNPSGVDNSLIVYETPLLFVRGYGHHLLSYSTPLTFLVVDSGLEGSTLEAVRSVRSGYMRSSVSVMSVIGQLVQQASKALQFGQLEVLGMLMNRNHHLLQSLGVSNSELDRLCSGALAAGALGAKLSGGGMGGNLVILLDPAHDADSFSRLMYSYGAANVIVSPLF